MTMKTFEKIFPGLVLGIGLLYYLVPLGFKSYSSGGFNLDDYAALPCQDGGRIKPLDTSARTTLLLISGRQSFVDDKDERQAAVKWLLDVMTCFDPNSKAKQAHNSALDYK